MAEHSQLHLIKIVYAHIQRYHTALSLACPRQQAGLGPNEHIQGAVRILTLDL